MVVYRLKTGKEIYLDGYLKSGLDSLVYNIGEDWDFIILITGDRMVRTGKSVIAMSVCAYLADRLGTKYDVDDIYFDSETMVKEAMNKPKYSINHYDEARESLAASKHYKDVQQNIIDFFNECGQLNQIFVLVLPDFFTLKEEIAVGRSECLINVYRSEEEKMIDLYKEGIKIPVVDFRRGFFEFFNKQTKQKLFDLARSTKQKNYSLVASDFNGRFTNNYPIDEEAYRQKKADALKRLNENRKQKMISDRERNLCSLRDSLILEIYEKSLNQENKPLTQEAIAKILKDEYHYEIDRSLISLILKKKLNS